MASPWASSIWVQSHAGIVTEKSRACEEG